MAKKIKVPAKKARKAAPPAKVVKKSSPRNSPVPKAAIPLARREVTREMIAKRAYEIFVGGTGGDETHNWLRAERELKAGL